MKALRVIAILVVLLLLLGVWIASIFAPDLRTVAQAVTLAVVLAVVAFFLVRWLRARLKAKAIEKELTKQAGADDRPEIAALRAKMQSAVDALKRGPKGSRGGRASLYTLPWYVIVGPSAAGKTTALWRSGLSFVSADEGAPKVRGTAGTRNCDWWLSHEAIFLDTAGRFATEDNDHEEWVAFLDSLRRFRPDRPLDGLIVAVSLAGGASSETLAGTEAERTQLAEKLRARLDEVTRRLEIVLPVYLVLTKTDLVSGFVEFWSDLPKAKRSQVWGASFDLDDARLAEPARAVETELDLLLEGLHARLLERLPAERSPERRARIMQFPLELRAFRTPLGQFVETLCRPDADGQMPLLRGFYLTSGTQVGRPVDRVISGMLRSFDQQARPAAPGEEQSYFLTDVVRNVILPDRHLAVRSAAGADRRTRRELRFALAVLGVAAFLLLPAMVSYVRNTQVVADVDTATSALTTGDPTSIPGTPGDPLEVLLDTLDRVDLEVDRFSVPGWFGPAAARALRTPLWLTYLARLDANFHGRVQKVLDRRLSDISKATSLLDPPTSPGATTPLRDAYDDVKLYVTLVDPKGHVQTGWTPKRLAGFWEQTLSGLGPVENPRLERHADEYLKGLEADPQLSWQPPKYFQAARLRLKEFDAWLLPYNWVLRQAGDLPGLVTNDIVGQGQSLRYVICKGGDLVAGVYTKNGWRKIQPVLDSSDRWPAEGQIEPWVVPDARIPEDYDHLTAGVRNEYYERYSSEWLSVLDKCSVVRPTDPSVCKGELEALGGPNGFFDSLFSQFNDNVIAYETKETPLALLTQEGCSSKMPWAKADAGPPAPAKSPVEKSFKPLLVFAGLAVPDPAAPKSDAPPPIQNYKQILQSLMPLMETASQLRAPDVQPQLATARRGVEGLVNGVEEPTKDRLRKLLLPPVEAASGIVNSGVGGTISEGWNKQVWPVLHSLAETYPFDRAPNAHRENAANFEVFASFFKPPDGTLWGFVKGPLSDYVMQGVTSYIVKPGAASVGGEVLSCLGVAQEITDAFFAPGEDRGTKLAVLVDWSASDITDPKFSIGSKVTPLARGEWSPTLKWSGEETTLTFSQAGNQSQEIRGRGSFSLFDLFEQLGGLKPGGASRNYVAKSSSWPLIVKVRSESKEDPFGADFFSRLRCPSEVHPIAP
jgi:type VI secretion system protein ImpL